MNSNSLENRAKSGDPIAAYEFGLLCIEKGYEEIGHKWLQFAIDKGSEDASVELARLLNLKGLRTEARKALSFALLNRNPRAFYISGFIALGEQDFETAKSMFGLAYSSGISEARELAETASLLLLGQKVESAQLDNLEQEVDLALGARKHLEGKYEYRTDWWLGWFPTEDSPAAVKSAFEIYLIDLRWLVSQYTINCARRFDLPEWNAVTATHGNNEKAVAHVLRDPSTLQRAVGYVEANEIARFLMSIKQLDNGKANFPVNLNIKYLIRILPDIIDVGTRINPAARSRYLTLLPYLGNTYRNEIHGQLIDEAQLSQKQAVSGITAEETRRLCALRLEIEQSGIIDFAPFEELWDLKDFCPAAITPSQHDHLKGEWPLPGWKKLVDGSAKSGCTITFRDGGWRCEEPQTSRIVDELAQSPRSRMAKKAATPVRASAMAARPAKKAMPAKKAALVKKASPLKNDVTRVKDLRFLIDSAVSDGSLPFATVSTDWTERHLKFGPVTGVLSIEETTLRFDLQIAEVSSSTPVDTLEEFLSRKINNKQVRFIHNDNETPTIILVYKIDFAGQCDAPSVERTLKVAANLAIDSLKLCIKSDLVIRPNHAQLAHYGLLKPKPFQDKAKSRNWRDPELGAKFLFNKI